MWMDKEKLLMQWRKHRTREMFHGNKCLRIKEDEARDGSKNTNAKKNKNNLNAGIVLICRIFYIFILHDIKRISTYDECLQKKKLFAFTNSKRRTHKILHISLYFPLLLMLWCVETLDINFKSNASQ